MDALSKLFEAIESRNEQRNGENSATPEDLRARLHSLLNAQTFKVGDVIRYKPGLHHTRVPDYGQLVIVSEVLAEPIFPAETKGGSAYFRRPVDIVIGLIDESGDFVEYHVDSRRFELAESTH